MWQHHYVIHLMRMEALRAEADRERRWRLLDESNGRPGAGGGSGAGRVRAVMARVVATVSMASARFARRLDGRVAIDLGPDRLLRDAWEPPSGAGIR